MESTAHTPARTPRKTVGIIAFIVELGLVYFGIQLHVGGPSGAIALITWTVLATGYLLVGAVGVLDHMLRGTEHIAIFDVWKALKLSRPFRLLFPLFVSASGLVAASYALIAGRPNKAFDTASLYFPSVLSFFPDEELQEAAVALSQSLKFTAVYAIFLSWTLLHVGFARLYAWLDDTHLPGAVEFPGTPSPRFADFMYMAFTIGVSTAVSDNLVKHSRMRLYILFHAVVSFLYNTAVLAVAIKFILGS